MRDNTGMRRAFAICLICTLARAAQPDWSVHITPYQQVFPALELSQARRDGNAAVGEHVIGNGSGLIAVHVRARHAGERVVLRVAVPELGSPQAFGATLAQADVEYELHPPLAWDMTLLHSLSTARDTHMDFTLERDGAAAEKREAAISLRPL